MLKTYHGMCLDGLVYAPVDGGLGNECTVRSFSLSLLIIPCNTNMLSVMDQPFLKPPWASDQIPCVRPEIKSVILDMCDIFPRVLKRVIPLYLFT